MARANVHVQDNCMIRLGWNYAVGWDGWLDLVSRVRYLH